MMASAVEDDFVTCCVCTYKYDDEIRKPKYLVCSHTVCVCCLKKLLQDAIVKCPICRQETQIPQKNCSYLPNNSHALYILKLEKQRSETSRIARECYQYLEVSAGFSTTDEQRKKLEEYFCAIFINLPAEDEETISWRNDNNDLDVLHVLINQLLDIKDVADINAELAVIEKRREIDERLDSIMNAGNGRAPISSSSHSFEFRSETSLSEDYHSQIMALRLIPSPPDLYNTIPRVPNEWEFEYIFEYGVRDEFVDFFEYGDE